MGTGSEERTAGNTLAEKRTELAAIRTILAAGRNLMAWVRTSVSLIGFGFTLDKVMYSFRSKGLAPEMTASTPRTLGLFLIGLGTFPLILILGEYWNFMRQIGKTPAFILRVPSFMVACAILGLGLALFAIIMMRLDPF
jgi:putative membrane protein